MQFRLTAFDRVDWGRLVEHLTAALLAAVGGALVARPDVDIWVAIEPALKGWIGAALVYAGGYIQNAEKRPAGGS